MRRLTAKALCLVAAVLALVPAAAEAKSARALSGRPLPERAQWRSYVLGQGSGLVYPQRVDVAGGGGSAFSNPGGLEREGGGVTTIASSLTQQPQLVLDLGRNAGGHVEIGIATSSGATVRLGYSEARRFLTPSGDTGNPSLPPDIPFLSDPSLGSDDDPGDRFDDFTGTGELRSAAVRGAQRWISVQLTTPGTVAIDYVRVREQHLRPTRRDYAGRFLSSDDLLNRVWYAGVNTFALDSFKDLRPGHDGGNMVVTDGAKRDRLVWLGDLAIENQLGQYSLRQAPRIIRDSIQMFSCQQAADGEFPPNSEIAIACPDTPPDPAAPVPQNQPLPEYTAWWVVALHDYELHSGDSGFARRMLPVARRALEYFTSHLDSRGLYSTPPGSINWHPFDLATGEDAHTNAVIYRALVDGADLERRLGSGDGAAAAYRQQAARLRRAMLAHLWDPGEGAFVLNSQDPRHNHTEDAQVEAILSGAIKGKQATSALAFVEKNLDVRYGVANGQFDDDPYMSNYISPYMGSTDLLARLERKRTMSALRLVRREWGRMVDTDPKDTLWEKMAFDGDLASYSPNQTGTGTAANPDNSPGGRGITSMAHGWAGGPIPALSGYVLGIRPVTPGFATWVVEPQPGDLRWAQGRAPTTRGPVVSRWQRSAKNRSFKLTVSAPRGTRGTVYVPLLGHRRRIVRDGRLAKPAATANGYARFDRVSGRHTWAWARAGK